ncbi:serine/threonine-protein kinase [Amnibacterium setariae]|uniref:non-specific serine/threonine protein kinase n=1 Tax=Amnibacterium setariae TaxID=2306585 RepID=A0A3A1U346_9MICO|nr:serine/threonine-protein kinase [Amnibacterium setariae]RIX28277.1 serine/threonine protein kinase [Amnibacterium setariae]
MTIVSDPADPADPAGSARPDVSADATSRYRLDEVIGRGGNAAVHRAWDAALERWVAVKVLPAEPDEIAEHRRRREAQLLAMADHPALVALHDVVVTSESTWLVMELVEGGTLQQRMAGGPVPPAELADVAVDVADGLVHLHALGIVHRDVKPGNVLLAGDDGGRTRAKLTDFGLAKLLESASTRTAGLLLGTARYLSPEQAYGRTVGAASDVYSLGLALLEAATGEAAFPGPAVESLSARLLRDPDVPSRLGYGWRSLLTAMTRRDPDARPSAAEVAARLRSLGAVGAAHADPDPTEAIDTVPIAVIAPPRPRRLEAALQGSTGVLAALVLVAATAGVAMTAVPSAGDAVTTAAVQPADRAPQTLDVGAASTRSVTIDAVAAVRASAASSDGGGSGQRPQRAAGSRASVAVSSGSASTPGAGSGPRGPAQQSGQEHAKEKPVAANGGGKVAGASKGKGGGGGKGKGKGGPAGTPGRGPGRH